MENWYENAFSADYIRTYKHRDHSEAQTAVDTILNQINLPEDAVCLDLCCGFGRHMSYLAKRGVVAYGIDLSSDLLQVANRLEGTRGRLVRADMRRIAFRRCFDFVFSFFSSFGYFSDDSENIRVLKEIRSVLNPHGAVLIDYINADYVRENLVPESYEEFPDFILVQRRCIIPGDNMIEKQLEIEDANGRRTYKERLKLYSLNDFEKFFDLAGLRVTQTFGDYTGSEFSKTSSRLIMIGENNEVGAT